MLAQRLGEAKPRLRPEIAIDEQAFVAIAQNAAKSVGSRRICEPQCRVADRPGNENVIAGFCAAALHERTGWDSADCAVTPIDSGPGV